MKIKINYECDLLKNIKDDWLKTLKKIQDEKGYLNVNEKSNLRYRELDTGVGYLLMKDWCIEVE